MDTTVPTNPADSETYRAEIGADGCGCPITAEISMANSSEVEGTQRTEHRPKCWAADPKGYAVTAAELRRIADALDTLPPGDARPYVQLSVLPDTAEAVDAVAVAVLGKPGQNQRIGDDWYHIVRGGGGKTGVYVTVQTTVPGPPDERDAEIERLRSELAKLQASTDTTGDSFSREPDEVKPTSAVPNGVDGHSEFSGRASVPDMQTRPITCLAVRGDGTTCGEPIYWNPPANAWWHQIDGPFRRTAFRHTATGLSVPPSDGGE